jgi:hypothetical protein
MQNKSKFCCLILQHIFMLHMIRDLLLIIVEMKNARLKKSNQFVKL